MDRISNRDANIQGACRGCMGGGCKRRHARHRTCSSYGVNWLIMETVFKMLFADWRGGLRLERICSNPDIREGLTNLVILEGADAPMKAELPTCMHEYEVFSKTTRLG